MKFKGVKKVESGKFITRYNLTYETEDHQNKTYEMISRNQDVANIEDLHNKRAEAVVLIMENPQHDKILLNKEYRLAVGEWVYNFPAGLIEPGELLEVAGDRELCEETGLHITEIYDILGESYTAVGLSNEKVVCLLGSADGEFKPSTSTVEEITAGWFSKEEAKNLLRTEKFSARAQIFLYMWVHGWSFPHS